MVCYYRETRGIDIAALIKAGEEDALTEGLSLKGERVRRLKQLAALMEKDLFGGFLWLDQVKGVGSGELAQIVDYEEFNKGEVDAYRGVLEDIAKELGHRTHQVDLRSIDLSQLTDMQLERIADGEDLLHVLATPGTS